MRAQADALSKVACEQSDADPSALVLLVEDDDFSRLFVRAILERAGYQVIAVGDGAAAVQVLAQQSPDLILTDIEMPRMSGFNLLSHLRSDEHKRHVPVIFMTSANDSSTKVAALDFGVNDIVVKPVDADELTARIRAQIRSATEKRRLRAQSSTDERAQPTRGDHLATVSLDEHAFRSDPLIGHMLARRYRVTARIGDGGMGIVYRALDTLLDADIAIKRIHPHLTADARRRARLQNEVRLTRLMSHHNVCRVYDIVDDNGELFITMELIDGEPLSTRIERRGPASITWAVRILRDIARGLDAAHEKRVIHRDLKPSNVLITEDDRAVIVDFGLAHQDGAARLTMEGTAIGTPAYMAPEQFQDTNLGTHTDVYALGLLAYELLTGVVPLVRSSLSATAAARITETASPMRDLRSDAPLALCALVTRCLSREPSHRPSYAGEVADALDDIAAQMSASQHLARSEPPEVTFSSTRETPQIAGPLCRWARAIGMPWAMFALSLGAAAGLAAYLFGN